MSADEEDPKIKEPITSISDMPLGKLTYRDAAGCIFRLRKNVDELESQLYKLAETTELESENATLRAELQAAREGISDLWRDCDKLPHAAYCDPTGFGYCTCYRSAFNAMLHNLHSAIVGATPPEQEE